MTGLLARRLNDPTKLPEPVRNSLAAWTVASRGLETNRGALIQALWDYSNNGWSSVYTEFVEDALRAFNTPSPKNVKDLCRKLLGLATLDQQWDAAGLSMDVTDIQDVIELRHGVAHGFHARTVPDAVVNDAVDKFLRVADTTHTCVVDGVAAIVRTCGKEYRIRSLQLEDLLKWLAQKPRPVTYCIDDLKHNSTWHGNHKKLEHDDWPFFEGPVRHRRATTTFYRFVDGEIAIPDSILSFGGKDSMSHPDARYLRFAEL